MRERTNNPRTEHNAAAALAVAMAAAAVVSSVSMEPKQHRAPTLTPSRSWSLRLSLSLVSGSKGAWAILAKWNYKGMPRPGRVLTS